MEECLVCGDEKNNFKTVCKMCGMGIKKSSCTNKGFIFCSIKCRNSFTKLVESLNKRQKIEIMLKRVVL